MSRPVYLFTGPEVGERNEAIKNIKSALSKKFGDPEEHLFYASETPPEEYLALLDNENLFSGATCVVVKCAESIKKAEELELLAKWIKSDGPDSSVLILVTEEYSVNSKIDKAVQASNKKTFFELSESSRKSWIMSFFSKNGYSIESDAVSMIIELSETNTEALKSECQRFLLIFEKGHTITADDVDSVLSSNKEETAFSIFDAMSSSKDGGSKNLEKSLEVLQRVRLSKENSAVQILAALSYSFRMLINYHKISSLGACDDFTLKRNGFTTKKSRLLYSRAQNVWTIGQCHGILASISKADMEIRQGGSALEDIYLQKLIYEAVTKKGASSALYE